MDGELGLHAYFIEGLMMSIPFLVAFIITLFTYRVAPKIISRPLNYILIGFLLGFIARVILSAVTAYVIQLPLLPLKLHQEGMSAKDIAIIISTYNIISMIVSIIIALTSLTLVGYGLYKLVGIVKDTLKIPASNE